MPIDSAEKRRSAVATRRLPWFRRFLPAPDGTIGQADRQQGAFVYAGILAAITDPTEGPATVFKAHRGERVFIAHRGPRVFVASREGDS